MTCDPRLLNRLVMEHSGGSAIEEARSHGSLTSNPSPRRRLVRPPSTDWRNERVRFQSEDSRSPRVGHMAATPFGGGTPSCEQPDEQPGDEQPRAASAATSGTG